MSFESILMLRFEVIITLIIFLLLIMKLNDADNKAKVFLSVINVLLLLNFIAGFLPIGEGALFSGFFKTSGLIVLEKNILNLGLMLISFTAYTWLLNNKNRIEFYILLLSSVLGVYTMISSGHILTLYLGLEMSTIPLGSACQLQQEHEELGRGRS